MTTLNQLHSITSAFKVRKARQPIFFMGHGSPMNAIADNIFTQNWQKIGASIELPEAVLVISAHWLTRGTHITAMEQPQTIHDFGGFPETLYKVQYPAKGSPLLAEETAKLITTTHAGLNHDWGLDHGTWSIVRHMFPHANVPVIQLSIDLPKNASYHYRLAQELTQLRQRGVLIIGSGNFIHNLRMIDWQNVDSIGVGYDWAKELNETVKRHVAAGNHQALIDYHSMGSAVPMAIPTPDHYYPMLYILGLQNSGDEVQFFNDYLVGGSLNMTSFRMG